MLLLPFFSVIIPTFNRVHLISKTIECILFQTFSDFEIIIIDDASVDNTEHIILQFNDERILYHKNEINIERSASRNKGIHLAKGKYICFCDSDDHWKSNHLQLLFEKIKSENEPVAMFFTGMTWCFPDRKQEVIFPKPTGSLVEYVIKHQIAPSTSCFSKTILNSHEFNTDLKINEDVELFARIVANFKLIQIPLSTVDFQIHNENTKALTIDYISPQLVATELIFNNTLIKNKLSTEFKREIIRNLRHQLINFYHESNESKKLIVEVSRFLLKYPRDWQNKSKIFMLLQHLPITKQILNNRKN